MQKDSSGKENLKKDTSEKNNSEKDNFEQEKLKKDNSKQGKSQKGHFWKRTILKRTWTVNTVQSTRSSQSGPVNQVWQTRSASRRGGGVGRSSHIPSGAR